MKSKTAIFLIVMLIAVAKLNAGESMRCHSLFQIDAIRAGLISGVSLTYDPVLIIGDSARRFSDHVFVETYLLGSDIPASQLLRPYTNYAGLPEVYGSKKLHQAGLLAIYQNYGPRVPLETVKMVKQVETSLPLERVSTFLVSTNYMEGASAVKGFMRLFDGTNGKDENWTYKMPLPLERILTAQGKSTTVIDQKRAEGNEVIEIGKYFISETLEPTEMKLVKKSILLWLLDAVKSREAKNFNRTFYFAHVASRAHLISYQRYWGFKLADRVLSSGLDTDENILMIRADELVLQLEKLIEKQNG